MGRQRARSDDGTEFSRHDAAIWHTRKIVRSAREGDVAALPRIATTFPAQFAVDEVMVAVGQFEVLTWRAPGNGAYTHDSGFFFATGNGGLAATAMVAGARAMGNSARRSRAAAGTIPRWMLELTGHLFVSTHGFYLETRSGLLPWSWASVVSMQLAQPGAVYLRGHSTTGPVAWLVRSDWVELLFAFWALVRHPAHPQLGGDAWIPPGWADREAMRSLVGTRQISSGDERRKGRSSVKWHIGGA